MADNDGTAAEGPLKAEDTPQDLQATEITGQQDRMATLAGDQKTSGGRAHETETAPDSGQAPGHPATDQIVPDRTVIASSEPPPLESTVISDTTPANPAPLPARLVEPGTLINNNYQIEALVSAGGMGEVYRAINVFTGDPVAVKVILPELARDQDIINLFLHEARILVQLRDDAIVSYHNFILDQGLGRYCLIMEFVEGAHLGNRIRDNIVMPDDDAIRLMQRLARGLGQAHARGITHRDLSPDNVILRHDHIDEAVLIDFGIARSTEIGDGLAGRFAGKFKYIAPEQLGHYDGNIDARTDIYGLALLIAASLRGSPLDMGDSVVTASDARQAIPDLSGLSYRIFPLLQHMLEPDPAARPENMGQIMAMLDDPMRIPVRYRLPLWADTAATKISVDETTGISESPFGAPVTPSASIPPPQPPPVTRRRAWPVVVGGILALSLVAGAGWYVLRNPAAPISPDTENTSSAAEPPTLPPRDPASRDGFLASLELGDCVTAQRITAGIGSGMIEVLAPRQMDITELQNAYATAFGTHPAITFRRITKAQCPALDFTRTLAGRVAIPPGISTDTRITPTGFQVEAQITGTGDRNLWIVLVAPDGATYDLTGQSRENGDGSISVGAAIDMPEGAAPGSEPYLLLVVTSSQPLVAVAAAPAGINAETILPAVLAELQGDGDAAVASLAALEISQLITTETDESTDTASAPD
ncbi:MAG: serine/threonine-protein kinase [Paracoccus sp. (in: a-proteobacteria)]